MRKSISDINMIQMRYIVFVLILCGISACTSTTPPTMETPQKKSTKFQDFDIFNMNPIGPIIENDVEYDHYVIVDYDANDKINHVELIDRKISMNLIFKPRYDSLTGSYLWRSDTSSKYGEPVSYFTFIKNGMLLEYYFYAPDSIMFLQSIIKTNKDQSEKWVAGFPLSIRMPENVQWDYYKSISTDSFSYETDRYNVKGDTLLVTSGLEPNLIKPYLLSGRSYLWYKYLGMYYKAE